jgi:biotin carboxylase
MRALLLVHQGAPSTASLVAFLRGRGYEPFVLSSAPPSGPAGFATTCRALGVEYTVSPRCTLTVEEVMRTALALADCRFCFTIRDGQREAMASVNRALGAPDPTPEATRTAVDKHRMRLALYDLGLTAVRSFRLDDPELRARLDRGERHMVKPRSGTGSLCTRLVDSWAQVLDQRFAFARGVGHEDTLAEYFTANELVAETFVEGRELSFEVIRQGGTTRLACDHERTVREFTEETVLERGFASPPVLISSGEVRSARRHMDEVLGALGLDDGCYHVELIVGMDSTCEIVEINPRPGGQYMVDSVRLQLGRSIGDDWVDVLTGVDVAQAGARSCGTYYQAHYLEPGRQVIGMERDPTLPVPELASGLVQGGRVARADREELGAMTLWRTELATHEETVHTLMPREHASFVYARGLRGRPLFLAIEPGHHSYQVVEAADRMGFDVVVFHARPLPSGGPYAHCRTAIALAHPMTDWDDWDACFAEVLAVCGDGPVAGTYCTVELLLEFEARLQEHYGLPGKGVATLRTLLDKLTTRRMLADAGLTGLRFFDREQARRLGEWPVGDRALYFKPTHGADSAFVRRCTTLDEVRAAIEAWIAADRTAIPLLGRYLDSDDAAFFLEEEAVGELLSVEGYVHGGRYHAFGLTSHTLLRRDTTIEMGSTFPYEHPHEPAIVAAVARLHEVLGVRHGPTHTEVMVGPDGSVELVELNLRFIGVDCLTQMNLAYDVCIEEDLVALATGAAPSQPLVRRRFTSLQRLLPPRGTTTLESLRLPVDDLPLVRTVTQPGAAVASTDRQVDYIAAYIVAGDTYENTLRRALDIRRDTLVNGEPLADNPNNVVV